MSKKGGIKSTGIEKWILTTAGVIGGLWSLVVATLAVFMAMDYDKEVRQDA